MPKRKCPHPFRAGYRLELRYARRATDLPAHGSGPRCRLDFNPSDDGIWSMLQIMRVEGDEVEEYTCAMPRCYAVPLILMNKRLAFFEASCRPDGTPIDPPRPPTTTDKDGTDGGGSGSGGSLRERDLLEYMYLWRVRTRFLQAVFDMNHERRLDERWRRDGIHGFVHRLYRRFGHEDNQRILYWRSEIKAGRVPYSTPDIADMDWESHILKDVASGAHNGFLWNRVSQGYDRVVKDKPPQEASRAWRRAASRDLKPALHRTPARDLPSVGSDESGHGARPEQMMPTQTRSRSRLRLRSESRSRSQSQTPAPRGPLDAAEEAEVVGPSVTSPRVAAGSASGSADVGCCAGVNGDDEEGDDDDDDDTLDYEIVLTEALTPEHTHEWTLPFPASGQSSEGASTSSPGRLSPKEVLLKFNAPENMKLAVIQCTFSPVEDVGEDFSTQLKVDYSSSVHIKDRNP